MTAKELIEFLSGVPPDTVVSMPGYEGGIADVKHARLTQVLLDVSHEDYYGPREEATDESRKIYWATATAPRVLLIEGWAR